MYRRHTCLRLRFADDDRFWTGSEECALEQLGRSGSFGMVDLERAVKKLSSLWGDIGWNGWWIRLTDLAPSVTGSLADSG
jgi:hypothetical protein